MDKPIRKRFKPKKIITLLDCLQTSISSDKETVGKMYDKIVEFMKEKDPEFDAGSLEDRDIPEVCRADAVQRVDKEIQVRMNESSKVEVETNTAPVTEESSPPVANGFLAPCDTNGFTALSSYKPPSSGNKVNKSKPQTPFGSNVVIKVEDSGSDDSNHSEEIQRTEHLVHRMMAPCSVPDNSTSRKSVLHFVVVENLPPRTSAEELVEELFVGLLGMSREDVTGITVHPEKTESVAQIYFKDLKHVQKTLVFSGKLVFKGRVITSKIGSS